ncbi:protein kinase [Nocardioides sp. Root122]|uniref:Stk1 family PASTA domain-containing Ser/Thr kinase n=1 Tax=Nocardioides TaxID=1839 RepID=UPI000703B210|nr:MULTISPECIES: PASTA domain-containing protein [Nocardioides]KQV73428.1 protein kinase [Nocardioides sp. Root122]MCK9825602.1 PASTA domain-containing protein [Nocardioides cavernae]
MEPPEHARAAAPGAAGDPLVGRLLDRRYRIGPRVARGGMASVYEATDTRLDRTVAVKVMHPGLGDDEDFAARFVREARAAARLNHPHVVGVYDQGDDTSDGTDTVFLVMEYVPGHTLRDVIRKESPMTPARALALLEPVVSALAAAHRAGLVHRDVKPENVLIADEAHGGQVKVADFGLAKAVSADTQHTATGGVLIGTVSYLAPELVVDGRADARADVYAVGVVLYELLTGRKPHEGESPIQVAYRHVHHDVPLPSLAEPRIPDYVDALVARSTSRDRSQRPADASVLLHHVHRVAQALREGLESDPELAADLMPRRAPDVSDGADEGVDHTMPQPFDAAALALLTEVDPKESGLVDDGSPDRTTALERHPAAAAPVTPVVDEAPVTTAMPVRGPDGTTARTPAPTRKPPRAPSKVAPVTTTARRRSVKGPVVLLLALLLVAGVGVGAYWFGWARYTTTPAVLGLDESAAGALLERAGLDAEAGDPAYSENVAAGLVIATDPEPGGKVLDGGTVTLTLSLGPERYDVPPLEGQTEDQAQDALAATNLVFGKSVGRWSETVPEGQVIRTSPKAGTTVKPGAAVDLVLSKGRKPITVKDWTGKSFDAAKAALEKRQLEVSVTGEEYSDTVPEGDVISQDPTTGTLFRGDTVSFVVSQGPELVEVPRVRAMGAEAATELLQGLGFEVRTEEADNYLGLGFVFSSDPDQGEQVPKGSTITLFLI